MSDSSLTVHVALHERAYDIHVSTGSLSSVVDRLAAAVGKLTHAVVIADEAVVDPHANAVLDAFASTTGVRADLVAVASGEPSKSVAHAQQLWEKMLEFRADRKSCVVAIGGGVVGDLAGFIAATFARGIPFCQVPTTLLAQVDSSVGGKTGINLPNAKNMVGAFWQPATVVIDTDVLNSLPDREFVSGLAEVVKYGVIMDAEFFERLEVSVAEILARDPTTLRDVVARCCRLKADVVEADERETTGRRAILNYGHTFAHAFEAVGGYGQLLHGEAVSIGMVCASRLAERLGRVTKDDTQRQVDILEGMGLPTAVPDLDPDLLWNAMQRDKKVEHGNLRFILPTKIGHVESVPDVAQADAMAAMQVD